MVHTILTFGVLTGIVLMFTGMAVARLVLEASGTPAQNFSNGNKLDISNH